MKLFKKLQISFWELYATIFDLRPRMHIPKFTDYPIASTPIAEDDKYEYPEDIKVLFEWEEKGRRWVVFSRN